MPTSFDVQLAELHASAQDVLVSGSMNQACRMIAAELELLSSERGISPLRLAETIWDYGEAFHKRGQRIDPKAPAALLFAKKEYMKWAIYYLERAKAHAATAIPATPALEISAVTDLRPIRETRSTTINNRSESPTRRRSRRQEAVTVDTTAHDRPASRDYKNQFYGSNRLSSTSSLTSNTTSSSINTVRDNGRNLRTSHNDNNLQALALGRKNSDVGTLSSYHTASSQIVDTAPPSVSNGFFGDSETTPHRVKGPRDAERSPLSLPSRTRTVSQYHVPASRTEAPVAVEETSDTANVEALTVARVRDVARGRQTPGSPDNVLSQMNVTAKDAHRISGAVAAKFPDLRIAMRVYDPLVSLEAGVSHVGTAGRFPPGTPSARGLSMGTIVMSPEMGVSAMDTVGRLHLSGTPSSKAFSIGTLTDKLRGAFRSPTAPPTFGAVSSAAAAVASSVYEGSPFRNNNAPPSSPVRGRARAGTVYEPAGLHPFVDVPDLGPLVTDEHAYSTESPKEESPQLPSHIRPAPVSETESPGISPVMADIPSSPPLRLSAPVRLRTTAADAFTQTPRPVAARLPFFPRRRRVPARFDDRHVTLSGRDGRPERRGVKLPARTAIEVLEDKIEASLMLARQDYTRVGLALAEFVGESLEEAIEQARMGGERKGGKAK